MRNVSVESTLLTPLCKKVLETRKTSGERTLYKLTSNVTDEQEWNDYSLFSKHKD